jgi:hypothetical protein
MLTTRVQLSPASGPFSQIQKVALYIRTAALPVVVLTAVPLEVCLAAELQQSAAGQYFGVVGLKEHQTGLAAVVVGPAAPDPAAVLVRDQP